MFKTQVCQELDNPAQSSKDRKWGISRKKLYYDQAQSSQDPKRGISSTKVVTNITICGFDCQNDDKKKR